MLDMITEKVAAPDVDQNAPFRMQISALDSNSYVGVIGIGRITGGSVRPNDRVIVVDKRWSRAKS